VTAPNVINVQPLMERALDALNRMYAATDAMRGTNPAALDEARTRAANVSREIRDVLNTATQPRPRTGSPFRTALPRTFVESGFDQMGDVAAEGQRATCQREQQAALDGMPWRAVSVAPDTLPGGLPSTVPWQRITKDFTP
jgi:hypothetical protein